MQVSKYWKPLYCLHNMTLAQSPHITWDNLSIEISPGKTCASFCRRKPNADNAVFSVPASWARSKVRQRWAVRESMRVVGVFKKTHMQQRSAIVKHGNQGLPRFWYTYYMVCTDRNPGQWAQPMVNQTNIVFFSIWILWFPFSLGSLIPGVFEDYLLWLSMQFWRRYSSGPDAQAA